jgi:hypothetical protein
LYFDQSKLILALYRFCWLRRHTAAAAGLRRRLLAFAWPVNAAYRFYLLAGAYGTLISPVNPFRS